jgi:hypothetical protein
MNFYVFPAITQVFSLIPKRTGPIRAAQGRIQIENVEKGPWCDRFKEFRIKERENLDKRCSL